MKPQTSQTLPSGSLQVAALFAPLPRNRETADCSEEWVWYFFRTLTEKPVQNWLFLWELVLVVKKKHTHPPQQVLVDPLCMYLRSRDQDYQ